MKSKNLIALPAKPVVEDDCDILWTISVGGAYREEALTIKLEGDKTKFWWINVKAFTFESAEAMREQACRRLGLRASDGFRKETQA